MLKESKQDRFLIYQPNHGFGVELFLLETAFELAKTLDRTLVLPPMPDLETLNYRRSLDSYFQIKTNWPWISTEKYRRLYPDTIDQVYHIVPFYRPEYSSTEARNLHPVWLDNIDRLTSFAAMGFKLGEVTRLEVYRPMTLAGVARAFDSDAAAIGISYINGIVVEVNQKIEPQNIDFMRLQHIPTCVSDKYLDMARAFAGDSSYAALHWRRAYHIKEMAQLLENTQLPTLATMLDYVPRSLRNLIVASDVDVSGADLCFGDRMVRSFRDHDPQTNAVVDMSLCVAADSFIGVRASTFSTYIAFVRQVNGLTGSTVLL